MNVNLIREVPNSIPDDLCDSIIKAFEDNPQHRYKGMVGYGDVKPSVKDSEDLKLVRGLSDEFARLDNALYDIVTKQNVEYVELYAKTLWESESDRQLVRQKVMSDTGFQIQKTVKNGGYVWHHDFDVAPVLDTFPMPKDGPLPMVGIKERLYTFLYYLTDDFEGGRTQFYFNGEIHNIIPEKGKALWFPSTPEYVHRGETVTSGEKYVMTGWISHETYRFTTGTYTRSEEVREEFNEPGTVFPYMR